MNEQFETNISQNLIDTQNEMRKRFEKVEGAINALTSNINDMRAIFTATMVEEQKIRTNLERDLQILKTKIENMLEDITDIQEKISEEFGQKESFIKRLFG